MSETQVADTWERGDPYERYVGRWSRAVGAVFVPWLDVPSGCRWLDVGCGTGALCEAIVAEAAPLSVLGVDPSSGFLDTARKRLGDRAKFKEGSAEALPVEDASVDVAASALMLNFVPDPHAALGEMKRVTAPGGTIGVYLWDYAGKMELMRYFWDAATAIDPQAGALDEGMRFPLCRPDALSALFAQAGLDRPEVTSIDVPTVFADFEDYWQPFLGGQGPAPAYVAALDASRRDRLRDALKARLPQAADGSIALVARAWAVRGRVRI